MFAGIGLNGRGAVYSAGLHGAASGAGAIPLVASPVMSIAAISVHKLLTKVLATKVPSPAHHVLLADLPSCMSR